MAGNEGMDRQGRQLLIQRSQNNPTGQLREDLGSERGGAWDLDGLLRAANRNYNHPDEASYVVGFRCAQE